jgi:hypothetical protein
MIIDAKISCLAFDIHKSKLVIAEWHFAKASKTYNCLVFSTNPSSNSRKNCFLQGKVNFGHKCILTFATNYFPQIVKEDGFDN